jgi:hypothetical protein
VIQLAMGWEAIHLYEFGLRAVWYGSPELSASSPDVTLAALKLRKGARFHYHYDLNIPRCHEVRLEDRTMEAAGGGWPTCAGGDGACPPEDCGGPEAFMDSRDDLMSFDGLEDLREMAEILDETVLKGNRKLLDDEETRWRLEGAMDRTEARDRARGVAFSRREVNQRLRRCEWRDFMYQRW